MKYLSVHQWSPIKRGIAAAFLVWSLLAWNYYHSLPYRTKVVVQALEANELQTARDLLEEDHDWALIINEIGARHDVCLWQRALDVQFREYSQGDEYYRSERFWRETVAVSRQLIDKGAKPTYDHLVSSIGYKGEPMTLLLLSRGAPAFERHRRSEALYRAAEQGSVLLVQKLIRQGASVNDVDGTDYHPLDGASFAGSKDVAKILLQHGADPLLSCRLYYDERQAIWESIRERVRHGIEDNRRDYNEVWQLVKPIVEKKLGHSVED